MPTSRQNSFNTGAILRSAGKFNGAFCVAEDSAVVRSRGHGLSYEQTSRGTIYSCFTPLAGSTIVAANGVSDITFDGPAAAAATLLSLLNPVGSGVNLEILRGWVFSISATSVAGGAWAWCGQTPGVLITAAEATALKRPHFIGQAVPHVKAWTQVALTGGLNHTIIRPFNYSRDATGGGTGNNEVIVAEDFVDGAIVVPQGAVVTIAPLNTGGATSWVVGVGIQYAEVPLPEG